MDGEAKGRALVERLVSGDLGGVAATFDAAMSAALPAAKLGEVWAGIAGSVGPFQAIEQIVARELDGGEAVVAVCRFERARLAVRIGFDGAGRVRGLFFQPAPPPPSDSRPPYVRPDSFTEVEVAIGPEGDDLGGTLSMPVGEGPFAAVVLVHGSGPHDRDEAVGANRPFRDIAHGLASAGIAALRYEKRTKARPESVMSLAALTVKEETIDDAARAVALLRAAPRIDPSRVFVAGHSLGGNVAPRIGEAAPEVAGLVVLAGSARPLEDLVLEQTMYLAPMQAPPDVAEAHLAALRAQIERVKSKDLSADTPASELPLGIPASYWIDLRGYDPPAVARRLGKPILVVQGGRDYQVTTADFDLWKSGLEGQPFAHFALFADLNHLFMAGSGKSRPEEYTLSGHVDEDVVGAIAAFVRRSRT